MDEMYQISRFIAKFDYEYSSICVVSIATAQALVSSETHVDVVVLIVWVVVSMVLVMYESSSRISHKIVLYELLLPCHQSKNKVVNVVLVGNGK